MVNADFERCTDFLARMIEKYGGELDLAKTEENEGNSEDFWMPFLPVGRRCG